MVSISKMIVQQAARRRVFEMMRSGEVDTRRRTVRLESPAPITDEIKTNIGVDSPNLKGKERL